MMADTELTQNNQPATFDEQGNQLPTPRQLFSSGAEENLDRDQHRFLFPQNSGTGYAFQISTDFGFTEPCSCTVFYSSKIPDM